MDDAPSIPLLLFAIGGFLALVTFICIAMTALNIEKLLGIMRRLEARLNNIDKPNEDATLASSGAAIQPTEKS